MAIGSPIIPRKPSLTVKYGTAAAIDLSAGIRSLDITEEEEMTDIPTFDAPDAQVAGRVTTTVTIPFYWTDDFLEALQPQLGEEGEFTVKYNPTDTKQTVFKGTIARVPFGTIEPNAPIEAELSVAVTVAPTRVAVPAP